MDNITPPLIAGAGPVGLAAALFLARQGVHMRIIDAAPAPSPYSRALAVNPRTLELLEPTGVTERMLERGLRIHKLCLRRNEKISATFSLQGIHHRYPFILALSQAATETLLTEALNQLGQQVERGTKLTECHQEGSTVTARLERQGDIETLAPEWLLAADGAHSTVREQLGIGFDGSSFPESWQLADIPLKTDLPQDSGHVWFFDDGGFLFLLRVVDDIRVPTHTAPLWRVISNLPAPLELLKLAEPAGAPVWESRFHVSHRMATRLGTGNIYLAGDAAHIHSPIGARGMNLGIEDSWVFAELMKAGTPERYAALRKAVDAKVVRRVELLTTVARGKSHTTRMLRRGLLRFLPHVPFLAGQMRKTVSGLDHSVGDAAAMHRHLL